MNRLLKQEIRDGGLLYWKEDFLSKDKADELFQILVEKVPWHSEGSRGRVFPRLVAYYADPGMDYTYSGITHKALDWLPELLEYKQQIEAITESTFNALLLNRYRDGRDSMGYHTDAEPELGTNPVIASLSLGATRRFLIKHIREKETLKFDLSHGSLLIMAGTSQHFWLHSIPKTKQVVGERINLTFRKMVTSTAATVASSFGEVDPAKSHAHPLPNSEC